MGADPTEIEMGTEGAEFEVRPAQREPVATTAAPSPAAVATPES